MSLVQDNNSIKLSNMSTTVQNISLYVPHVFANYSKEDVTKVFNDYVGDVKEIDFVTKKSQDGRNYNAAYIHFHSWRNNPATVNLQQRILDPNQEARLVYDDPWYWIVLENKGQKSARSVATKPRIVDYDANFPVITTPPAAAACIPPNAPVKLRKVSVACLLKPVGIKLENEFDAIANEAADDEIKMNELYEMMEREEQFLVTVDSRYLRTIEQENVGLRAQLASLDQQHVDMKMAYAHLVNAYSSECLKNETMTRGHY
jgi:hypothetical protein